MSGRTIVLARIEEETYIARHGQVDIGRPHVFGVRPKPVAMVWLNSGAESDILAARAWAAGAGYSVLDYPENTANVLAVARRDILNQPSAHPGAGE